MISLVIFFFTFCKHKNSLTWIAVCLASLKDFVLDHCLRFVRYSMTQTEIQILIKCMNGYGS